MISVYREPTDEEKAAFHEAQRMAMIETYRQGVAMNAMVAMCVRAEDDASVVAIAKRAKRMADALVEQIFGE